VKRAGIFITTSSYTEGAVNYATNHNIRLIDGKILEKMIKGKAF
jgi:restriction endonuclease Mrr